MELVQSDRMEVPQLALQVISMALKSEYHLNMIQTTSLLKIVRSFESKPLNDMIIQFLADILLSYMDTKYGIPSFEYVDLITSRPDRNG